MHRIHVDRSDLVMSMCIHR